MEGIKRNNKRKKSLNKKNTHLSVFILLLLLTTITNGLILFHMGPSSFIDSFNHPEKYMFLSQDQLVSNLNNSNQFGIIVKNQFPPNINSQNLDLCYRINKDKYVLYSSTSHYNQIKNSSHYIGDVITVIPDTPLSTISLYWWQQTKNLVQQTIPKLENLIK